MHSIIIIFTYNTVFVLSAILAFIGFSLLRQQKEAQIKEEVQVQRVKLRKYASLKCCSLLQIDPIELEFGYGIIPLADVNQGGDLLDRVVMIRRQLALELGMIVPIIRLRDNIQLALMNIW
jgi:flagellar biosynthesis protein FlhA